MSRADELQRHLDELERKRFDPRVIEDLLRLVRFVPDHLLVHDVAPERRATAHLRDHLSWILEDAKEDLLALEADRQRHLFNTRKALQVAKDADENAPPPPLPRSTDCVFCRERNAKDTCTKCGQHVHRYCRTAHEARCQGGTP